ncbi:MAG: putative cytochrome c class protein [Tardiphaga sp.]|nr:putative cytochrome c class protein [Tardiphaga sp.]MDB5624235.1 putative cytochrome c class protein [Tardiphaga sp.]
MRGRDRYRAILIAAAVVLAGAGTVAVVVSGQQQQSDVALALTGGDASRAPPLLRRYGCAGCHTIPGIPGADGQVGAPLRDMRSRVYVGGVLPNNADNLIKWIVSPTTFNPKSAMPRTGVSESEARDIAAYLYAQ